MKWISGFLILWLLFGCVGTQNQSNTQELAVSFTWDNIERCSRTSPEIQLAAIPAGTETFNIKLKDLDVPKWNHGGGSVSNDGSGIIPSGALKSGYNGPCPPSGSHRYRFTVKALDGNGKVTGIGAAVQNYP